MLIKRSVTISNHATSITLEKEFWDELKKITLEKDLSLNALMTLIDAERNTDQNLSSKTRVYILNYFKSKNHAS